MALLEVENLSFAYASPEEELPGEKRRSAKNKAKNTSASASADTVSVDTSASDSVSDTSAFATSRYALRGVGFTVERGSFTAVCGATGSGKSTLLRLLKRGLAPPGELTGEIRWDGAPLGELDERTAAFAIGFVGQRPEQQTVADRVWRELAFGLENAGLPGGEIRRRVAETACWFGIEEWFDRPVSALSGGQLQLLNLASVMVTRPELLLLDEPTAQLDPVAASDFIASLVRLNRELSLTVVIAEHRLEEVAPVSDHMLALGADGGVIAFGDTRETARRLCRCPEMLSAMPSAVRLYARLGGGEDEGKMGLNGASAADKSADGTSETENSAATSTNGALEIDKSSATSANGTSETENSSEKSTDSASASATSSDGTSAADKSAATSANGASETDKSAATSADGTSETENSPEKSTDNASASEKSTAASCPLTVREGRAFLAGRFNGVASPTQKPEPPRSPAAALEFKEAYFRYARELPDALCGLSLTVREGELFFVLGGNGSGKSTMLAAAAGLRRLYSGSVRVFGRDVRDYKGQSLYRGCLSMLPQDVQTLFLRATVAEELDYPDGEAALAAAALPLDVKSLAGRHPYDLSGGQQQLLALAKALSTRPRLLLLDEPTKGLDALAKGRIGGVLRELQGSGATVLAVTHDVEFAAEYADRCALFFRGETVSEGPPRAFFSGNAFYTTAVNRMTRGLWDGLLAVEDAVRLRGAERDGHTG